MRCHSDALERHEETERKLNKMGFPLVPWIFLSSGSPESELAFIELGSTAWLYWSSSPYDSPQFTDGLMYWERNQNKLCS